MMKRRFNRTPIPQCSPEQAVYSVEGRLYPDAYEALRELQRLQHNHRAANGPGTYSDVRSERLDGASETQQQAEWDEASDRLNAENLGISVETLHRLREDERERREMSYCDYYED
jgi:hypothetical protein